MKYKWIPVNLNAPFAPRDGAGLLSFKGKLYIMLFASEFIADSVNGP
jgi:hypothetical protein